MDMLKRHMADLFAAINNCYQKQLLMPCLVLLYSGIDVAASLEPSKAQSVGKRFEKWVQRYMLGGQSLPCTATELYAARCAVIHTFTPDSNISRAGSARVIAYAHGSADVKKLDEATVLSGRQKLQVNVHLWDLIAAFHAGYEGYLKEVFADSARQKKLMEQANRWTASIDRAKVEQYVAVKSSTSAPSNPTTTRN